MLEGIPRVEASSANRAERRRLVFLALALAIGTLMLYAPERQRADRVAEAEQEYRIGLKLSTDPVEQAQARNNLGILYLGMQRYPAAPAEFDAVIKLNPNEHNSYLGRETIEMNQFNCENAADDFAQAAEIAPAPQAYFLLRPALGAKGDLKSAAGAYVGALRRAPGFGEAKPGLDALRSGQGATK